MSLLHDHKPFLETNAWQKSNLNSLRYNTSQVGSVLPIIYGTARQQVNLIALGDYRGPKGGKKGKSSGPLPLSGTHAGKGGGGGGKKGAGSKKSSDFSVDVDFALCQGPVDIGDENLVWASGGTAFFQSVGLNLYTGEDGQEADPVFVGLGDIVGYSGTCHVTGTPMDLGASPVLPNLSFEITGFKTGTVGDNFPKDANPADCILDFLTNERYGAGFPADALDPDILTNYGAYCQAAQLPVSIALQSQTEAASWLSELARLTNTALLWSGSVLRFLPYGDAALDGNGASWSPNLTPLYSLTDDDYLPWNPHIDATDPQESEDDPVLVMRSNPADATNWMSIEYTDRVNDYNKTLIAQFDQASIDAYGLRTEASINGSCFAEKTAAEISVKLLLQRALYARNSYRFQLGWQHALLEPMDIVLLTDARCGLDRQAVRITSIEENENGDLAIEAEEIKLEDATASADTGCVADDPLWRVPIHSIAELYQTPPERIDKYGNFHFPQPTHDTSIRYASIYDDGGVLTQQITYDDLWDKIYTKVGVYHAPIYGGADDPAKNYALHYKLCPISNGEYVLAFMRRLLNGYQYAFWWALCTPGSLDVIGAFWYRGLTVWPYSNGFHVLDGVGSTHPILVQCYAFMGSTEAALGCLPSIGEFLTNNYIAGFFEGWVNNEVPNVMIWPIGGTDKTDRNFGSYLFYPQGTKYNQSRNFGFVLPGSRGAANYYIYANRQAMEDFAAHPATSPPEFHDVLAPEFPYGTILKFSLIDIVAPYPPTFHYLSQFSLLYPDASPFRGKPTGPYEIDTVNWLDENGDQAFPFLDEYTHITDDTPGGDDVYSLQAGVIDRGNDKFWVIFYMVGRADAAYRNAMLDPPGAPYDHPIYLRVRVFEYYSKTEVARQIAKNTCVLHSITDLPPDATDSVWESSNDNCLAFSVTEAGNVATLYVHGYLFKKAFMTFSIPIST